MLSAEQITHNWEKFLELIKTGISGERGEKLLSFYDQYADRIALMPASGKTSYHNAFAGGYVDHVLRVILLSMKISKLWKESGAIQDFTDEELIFVALNHDLGKFGTLEHEEYLQENEDYWIKKGQVYKHNPDIDFMKTSERSLFLLQQLGISLTQNEYLGIKLHDGLYEEGNKGYYIAYSEEYRLRSNLPYIIHQADLLATRIEHDTIAKPAAKVISGKNTVSSREKMMGKPSTKIENTLPPPSPNPVKSSNKKYSSLLSSI